MGYLGLGDITNKESPYEIPNLSNITAISTGGHHNLFLDINNNVYSCGLNYSGQLGLGDAGWDKQRKTPTPIPIFSNIRAISTGSEHSLFLDDSGNVYSCGANIGQLGLDDAGWDKQRERPELINYFNDNKIIITAISAGFNHSLFLKIS